MTTVEPQVATPVASQGITKVYAVQHAQIATLLTDPVGGAATFSEWIDVPASSRSRSRATWRPRNSEATTD
jgi:hypothetical protein